MTAAEQARFIKGAFATLEREPNVKAAVVYNLREKGTNPDFEDNFGLVKRDFTPKPGYNALKASLTGVDPAPGAARESPGSSGAPHAPGLRQPGAHGPGARRPRPRALEAPDPAPRRHSPPSPASVRAGARCASSCASGRAQPWPWARPRPARGSW